MKENWSSAHLCRVSPREKEVALQLNCVFTLWAGHEIKIKTKKQNKTKQQQKNKTKQNKTNKNKKTKKKKNTKIYITIWLTYFV